MTIEIECQEEEYSKAGMLTVIGPKYLGKAPALATNFSLFGIKIVSSSSCIISLGQPLSALHVALSIIGHHAVRNQLTSLVCPGISYSSSDPRSAALEEKGCWELPLRRLPWRHRTIVRDPIVRLGQGDMSKTWPSVRWGPGLHALWWGIDPGRGASEAVRPAAACCFGSERWERARRDAIVKTSVLKEGPKCEQGQGNGEGRSLEARKGVHWNAGWRFSVAIREG